MREEKVVAVKIEPVMMASPREKRTERGEEHLPRTTHGERRKRPSAASLGEGVACGKRREEKCDAAGKEILVAEDAWREVAESITLSEIDALISQARSSAEEAQGSQFEPTWTDSQPLSLNSSGACQGSGSSKESHSQAPLLRARALVRAFLDGPERTCSLEGLGGLLKDVLIMFESFPCCRPRPTTGRKDIFPLPVSEHPETSKRGQFLPLVAASLNSMYGVDHSTEARPSSLRVMKRLAAVVEHSEILAEPLPEVSFSTLFTTKGVDYQGDEIRVARKVVWESIEASLPSQVGTLDIRDFCHSGVLHYINHFEEFLIPAADQMVGKPPRVFVDDDEWGRVANGLLDRGICVARKLSDLHFIDGSPLVNGLFAVSKDEFHGSVELCRLIMNLKPVNALARPLEGDTCTLPMVTQLGSLYLEEGELLSISSEDLRCYFYLFSIPEAWQKYMGFGRALPLGLVPEGGHRDEVWVLCSRVLPMGFLNSVGIAQHIHRNVVRKAMGSLYPPLGGEHELRRDRLFSQLPTLYRVYLDNFDELRKTDRRLHELIGGHTSESVARLREAYAEAGLPTHPKKTVREVSSAEVQGAWINGEQGTMSAKPSKISRYVKLALELVGRGVASQKELQVVGGGMVYIAMFKRPLLGALNHLWRAIVALEGLPRDRQYPLPREAMVELVRFVGLVPLAFSSFRSDFDDMVTASDASSSGGVSAPLEGSHPMARQQLQAMFAVIFQSVMTPARCCR